MKWFISPAEHDVLQRKVEWLEQRLAALEKAQGVVIVAHPTQASIPVEWQGQDFAALRAEVEKPEYRGKSEVEIVSLLKRKLVPAPLLETIGFNLSEFHKGMVIHARRGGGI